MSALETFENGVAWVLIGLSLFCVNSLLLQHKHRRVGLHLAAFFLALAFNLSTSLFEVFIPEPGNNRVPFIYALASFPVNFMLAPLFWLYVRALTAEENPAPLRFKFLHALPTVIATVIVVCMGFHLEEIFTFAQTEGHELTGWPLALMTSMQLMAVFMEIQIVGYLGITIWTLKRYNSRLRDLFATTESRELYWLWWITISVALYSIFNVALILQFFLEFSYLPSWILDSGWLDTILTFTIIWVIALWGLRQKPGLLRTTQFGDLVPENQPEEAIKYERSALTPEHAARIARKIEAAMNKDLLYRNPSLSLWNLSNHIGVTSNYVSQTLNETLGASFFDYVNQARVTDAMRQILQSDRTVLEIAYDVGFNSRSPFYKAFKRETGTTPTAFKQTAD